jgi:hypothetical protein
MARGKATSRSAGRKHAEQNKPGGGAPTYPRSDLLPPELIIGSLAGWGQVALASNELNDEDRKALERAVQQLNELDVKLARLIARTAPASLLQGLVEQIGTIAGAAYLIGAHCAMTDTSRVFFERSRAQQMRLRRATSRKEQRVREAIEAEMKVIGGTVPSEHPYKDAEAICEQVKKRLAPDVLSVDAIARRIGARRNKS